MVILQLLSLISFFIFKLHSTLTGSQIIFLMDKNEIVIRILPKVLLLKFYQFYYYFIKFEVIELLWIKNDSYSN